MLRLLADGLSNADIAKELFLSEGTVPVFIDDQSYSFHEEAFDLLWNSPQLSPDDHFVRIMRESGGAITACLTIVSKLFEALFRLESKCEVYLTMRHSVIWII